MENQYSSLQIMADDTGMPDPDNSLAEYIKYLLGNKLILNTDDENVFYSLDKSNGKFVFYLEGKSFPEFHYCYETEITKQVMLSEFHTNHDGKDSGAMLIESTEGDYGLCAELDFYKLVKIPELPVKAEIKIYALALDVMFFKDKKDFDDQMNKSPIGDSPSGNPIYIGSKFISASGLVMESDEAPFPSFAFMTAEILGVESKTNEFTGKEFYVLRCDGTIGEFELLCSPEFANDNMKAGGVINGNVIFRMEVINLIK